MRSRGQSAKKKQDTFINFAKEEEKEPKGDVAMDGQPNIIRDEKPEEQAARAALFMNPFAQRQQPQAYVPPAKALVSVQTIMKHTGSKEELHRALTV